MPYSATYILIIFLNAPILGTEIAPDMASTLFQSVFWMRWDLNPQPFKNESSLLPTRPGWRPSLKSNGEIRHLWSISPKCLCSAFMLTYPKSVKIQSSCQYLYVLLGSTCIKAAHKKLMKLTPEQKDLYFLKVELARKRGWKGYWVCLKGTTLLFYPCDSQEGRSVEATPKHLIIVDGAIMQAIPEHPKRDFIFCLSTAFGDAYLFQVWTIISIDSLSKNSDSGYQTLFFFICLEH